ncbi:MAG TPA: LysR family transcriptional regulator [Stellaceae bacterium]|nr:LysR family transcriptional regulator [Stellaceae bacterium]
MDLELRHLRDFIAVIESGSLGDAARRLKTSQPTLTRNMKLLEKAIGGAVFDRTPHGMRPTALGRALERRARLIIGEVGSAQRELDDLVAARRGRVVIGSGPLFATSILPRAIARFQARYPNVDVMIIQSQMRLTLEAMRTGEIDCTFHSAPENLDPSFTHRVLLRGARPVIVTRSDNPLAAKRRVSLKELGAQPWMMPRQPDYFRQRIEAVFERADIPLSAPVMEYSSIIGSSRFLFERRELVSPYFDAFIDAEVPGGKLAHLRVPELSWAATSSVIHRSDTPLSPAAAKLVDTVRAVCSERRRHSRLAV